MFPGCFCEIFGPNNCQISQKNLGRFFMILVVFDKMMCIFCKELEQPTQDLKKFQDVPGKDTTVRNSGKESPYTF